MRNDRKPKWKFYIKNNRPLTKGNWGRSIRDGANGTAGYVYIVDLGMDHQFKIGMAGDVQKRLCSLRTSNLNARLVLSLRMPDARFAEKKLHHIFSSRHVEREIYTLSQRDIYAAERILSKMQKKYRQEQEANSHD